MGLAPGAVAHGGADRALALAVLGSIVLHAAAIHAVMLVRFHGEPLVIPVELVVVAAPGPEAPLAAPAAPVASRAPVRARRASRPAPPAVVAAPAGEVGPSPAATTPPPPAMPEPEPVVVSTPVEKSVTLVREPEPRIVAGLRAAPASPESEAESAEESPRARAVTWPGAGATTESQARGAPGLAAAQAATGTDGAANGARAFVGPRLIFPARPHYPEGERRAGAEGVTLVKAYVKTDGTVGALEVRRSSGRRAFDQAAIDAIRDSRFLPAERSGRPVGVWVEIPVQFRLKE